MWPENFELNRQNLNVTLGLMKHMQGFMHGSSQNLIFHLGFNYPMISLYEETQVVNTLSSFKDHYFIFL